MGSKRNEGRVQYAVPGMFQAELFGHCRDEATDTSKTNCKSYPCKKDSWCALDSLDKQTTLLPRTTRLQLPSPLFLQGQLRFWGLPLTLYALANLLSFLGGLCGLNK